MTSVANALITLAVFSAATVALLAIQGRRPVRPARPLPALRPPVLLIVVGFSLGASVLFLRYRDLNQVWELITHAGFFVAPVVYPLDIVPERLHFWLYLWPPTAVIQFARMVLVQRMVPTTWTATCCCWR